MMRGNGLTADDYSLVADISRTVAADALLALREAGVAAYVVLLEAPQADAEGEAQIFADRAALDEAREVVRRLAGDASPMTAPTSGEPYDDAWAQIIAGYARSADESGNAAATPEPPPSQQPPRPRSDREEHFVPPPAPPLPSTDRVGRLAWSGLFGGPLLLFLSAVFGWGLPAPLMLACVAAFVGGLITLVVRMKDRPPDHWGGDDGAVL